MAGRFNIGGPCSAADPILVTLSLGSNLEPRRERLARAVAAIGEFPGTRIVAESEIAETDPVGVPEEFQDLKFLNQVVFAETTLAAKEFSDRMHRIEDDLGRVRTVRNGPRTIDIDMIDYEGVVSSDPELTLPHPRALERDFVRGPWQRLVAPQTGCDMVY